MNVRINYFPNVNDASAFPCVCAFLNTIRHANVAGFEYDYKVVYVATKDKMGSSYIFTTPARTEEEAEEVVTDWLSRHGELYNSERERA